ncbi:hypothetical protein [Thermoanaerobacter uzonensis]|uniref:hypothetical protein n=1 Tax=Thermoanaerobacter uzonensis TaxID=447593 RepID=UPI003D76A373
MVFIWGHEMTNEDFVNFIVDKFNSFEKRFDNFEKRLDGFEERFDEAITKIKMKLKKTLD